VGMLPDVAAKSHPATFRLKCLLSPPASDERQMRRAMQLGQAGCGGLFDAAATGTPYVGRVG
jgi:hypothetical protein